jgi:hypothetical protein
MAGDGCLSRYKNKYVISISGNLKDDKLFYDKIIIPLLNKLRLKKTKYRIRPDWNKIEINFSDKLFFDKLKNLGFPVGKKLNQTLLLPKKLKNYASYFVAGLIATDGCIWFRTKNYKRPYPVIGIKNKCKTLVYQTYNFLRLLNLNPKLREVKLRNNPKSGAYEIAIYGHKNFNRFINLVGFVNPKHKLKYKTFLKESSF